MAQKYCQYLANLVFQHDGYTLCNKLWWKNDLYCNYKETKLDYFLKRREEILVNLYKGEVPQGCNECPYLHELENDEFSNKIKSIEINHWNQCNCACTYCSNREATKLEITKKRNNKGNVEIMPILKQFEKQGILDKDLKLNLVGGEPTVLKEFPDILKFVMKHHYSIDLSSNGIIYEKLIPKVLRETPNSYFLVSIDAGTSETFKKIKGVDEFDNVIKNLAKYVKESKETSNRIMAKYMLLEGVNDNKEEIDKWIEVCQSIGITSFFPDIEFCHAPKKSDVIPDNICYLYEYIKNQIRELNPKYAVPAYDFVDTFIKNKSFATK